MDPLPPADKAHRKQRSRLGKRLSKLTAALLRPATRSGWSRALLRWACHHRLLPHGVFKRWPVAQTFSVPVVTGQGDHRVFHYQSLPGDRIGRELFWAGLRGFEPETTRLLPVLLADCDWFIDIGACTGAYSLIACAVNPRLQAIAVEPVPGNYDQLLHHRQINQWQQRLACHPCAVSDQKGEAELFIPRHTGRNDKKTVARLLDDRPPALQGDLHKVTTVTVDGLVDAANIATGSRLVIKMDVEGFEDLVIAGMARTLKRLAPTLIVECNPDGPYRRVESLLGTAGYHFHHLLPSGPRAMAGIVPDKREINRNWLCMPGAQGIKAEPARSG